MKLKAATLAVGTEVTDGQITDRNSAWISQKLVQAGIQVIEHRAVADERDDIRRALSELFARADLLFVTGGLGPTSDDFTRDLFAEVFSLPLEFDERSWRHIEATLAERGIQARDIQKQQCYFPKGARILDNPAGTANAFQFEGHLDGRAAKVFALPGPPSEIAAIWEKHLASEIESLVPENEREELAIFRCLGRGESDVAEVTEEAIAGSGLRVGYRVHAPYVEVKIWYRANETEEAQKTLAKVALALKEWIVGRDHEDAADAVIDRCLAGHPVLILDRASEGILQERLLSRLRERKLGGRALPLTVISDWSGVSTGPSSSPEAGDFLNIELDKAGESWRLSGRIGGKPVGGAANDSSSLKSGEALCGTLELKPSFYYKVQTERARRFIAEKALLLFR